jgi:hypothetical protein
VAWVLEMVVYEFRAKIQQSFASTLALEENDVLGYI